MTLHERVLSVLAYKPVSEVIIGAPYAVTKDLIDRFRIDLVAQGARGDHMPDENELDPYELPKDMGIFRIVDSKNDMTTGAIIERIIAHRFVNIKNL
jgi:ethanolamine-phosphate cytidylyltransferase